MRVKIVFPVPLFQQALRQLAEAPQRLVPCLVGLNSHADDVQYLVRSVGDWSRDSPGGQHLVISLTERIPAEAALRAPLGSAGTLAHLAIGAGALEGRLWSLAKLSNHRQMPFAVTDSILLPGAAMAELVVSPPESLSFEQAQPRPSQSTNQERWSRTIGALGWHAWSRLTSLRIAIIGCGRTGSLVATTLVRMGVRHLTLIDPDKIEEHNLGEMDGVTDADLGQSKAFALARFLREHCASNQTALFINPLAKPIISAQSAATAAEILFCCVDNDAARLACGLIATLFHKVMVDISTGIHSTVAQPETRIPHSDFRDQTLRVMGADIRLILPADGCLVCFGKLANYEAALAALARGNPDLTQRQQARRQRWWEQRQGSLRTLNMLAASVGVQLLCDLIAGRLQTSAWIQAQYDQSGALSSEQMVRRAAWQTEHCSLCARAGLGSAGLAW